MNDRAHRDDSNDFFKLTAQFKTLAFPLAPSPSGAAPSRWTAIHVCCLCNMSVGTDEVIEHGKVCNVRQVSPLSWPSAVDWPRPSGDEAGAA